MKATGAELSYRYGIGFGAMFWFAAVGMAAAQTGVASNAIVVGQSAGLTGGQAEYSNDVRIGIEACFAWANKTGGVAGRTIQLKSLDDQGKKDLTLENTKTLVEAENAVALIGYTSGAGVEASLAYVEKARIALLSPATGNVQIREKFHPTLFHTRVGYREEMSKVVRDMASIGVKRFAALYLGDAGVANLRAMEDALAAAGLKPVISLGLDRNAEDFTKAVDSVLAAKPDAVLFITNGKPLVKIVQGMRKSGYAGQFITSSFSGLKVVDDLKKDAEGLVMVQVLPSPRRDHIRLVKDFRQHLGEFKSDAKPNYTNFEGYIAARVLLEALRRGSANRGRVIDALENIRSLDLGGYEISFSSKNHDGSKFVDTAVVGTGGALRF
jgi:branched-chain amino acid transport system substrate-binding protein